MSYRSRSQFLCALTVVSAVIFFDAPAQAVQYDVFDREAASATLPGAFAYLSKSDGTAYSGPGFHWYDDVTNTKYSAFPVILDTGSSGSLLSATDSTALKIPLVTNGGVNETYEDIGIGGKEEFYVSQPVGLNIAKMTNDIYKMTIDWEALDFTVYDDTENHSHYAPIGTYNFQVRRQDPISSFMGFEESVSFNIVGTPIINSRVMHVAPNVVTYSSSSPTIDYMQTELLTSMPTLPSSANAMRVQLNYVNFVSNTTTSVNTSTNPMIDGVTVNRIDNNGELESSSGQWLLDTGASLTMMGAKMANELGIFKQDIPDSSVAVTGVGSGTLSLSGYNVESLTIPLIGGDQLTFNNITIFVSWDGLPVDLPGILGMNLLGQSYDPNPITNPFGYYMQTESPFSDWYVNPGDGNLGELVLVFGETVPEPATLTLLAIAASTCLLWRNFRRRPT